MQTADSRLDLVGQILRIVTTCNWWLPMSLSHSDDEVNQNLSRTGERERVNLQDFQILNLQEQYQSEGRL